MVIDVLTVDITQNDTTICEGDSLVLLANGSQTYPSGSNNSQLSGTLNNGLVGYWPFNGNANDESGNGNNGTVNGATLRADRSGTLSSAYYLISGQEINFGYSSEFEITSNNIKTVSLWYYSQNGKYPFLSKYENSVSSNSNFFIGSAAPSFNPGTGSIITANGSNAYFFPMSNGTWHHLLVIYDGLSSNMKLYHNGIFIDSSNLNFNLNPSNKELKVQGDKMNVDYLDSDGIIDDIAIWDRALNSQEIQQLYSNQNYTYNWSPGGETTSSITVQPSATTTYTVDVTSGTTTCQSDVTVTVNPKDDPTFAYSASSYCSSDSDPSATISGTSGGIFTANSAGLNINSSSGLIDLDASTAGTYTIKYLTTGVCPDSSTQDITIHTSPTVDLGNDTTICTGNTLTLDAGAGYSYLWSDASTNQTLDVTTFGIYDVTITDNNNCTATDQINVLFETLSVFAGSDQTVCDGDSVTLSGSTSGTICATAAEGQPATLTAPAGAVFTSVVFASYGLPEGTCGSFTIGSCHSTTSQSVVEGLILGQNSVTIQAENGIFGDPCPGTVKKLFIEAQWSYSNSSTTFAWDNGVTDGATFVPTATTTYTVTGTNTNACTATDDVTITVLQVATHTLNTVACDSSLFDGNWLTSTGTYHDTLVAANGCDSIVTLNLTINNSPTVDLGIDTILCSGTTIDLNAGNGFSYLWSDATTNQFLTASTTGEYSVTITDGNGCTDSDTINVTLATPLVVTLDSTNITCNGLTDGTATATCNWRNT